MKKVSAMLLVMLMLVMTVVPFVAGAEGGVPVVTLSATDVKVAPGAEGTLSLQFAYGEAYGFINGSVFLVYNESELEAVVPYSEKTEDYQFTTLKGETIKDFTADGNILDKDTLGPADDVTLGEGQKVVKFTCANTSAIEATEGVLLNLPLKLKEGVTEATVAISGSDFSVYVWADKAFAAASVAPIDVTITAEALDTPVSTPVDTPTDAPDGTSVNTTVDETAAAAAATTTAAAAPTGENTPWAVLTVTALAGAALVGLTTKRR